MGEFSKKITTKNADGGLSETFTNSAEQGVISQLDYFDHDITNDANISGYYVVQPDNFVYNPRISVTAPCGPINRNRLNRAGVMSPLYTVFSVDGSVGKTYLEHYFKTSRWHDFMFLEGNSGARSDRFSISDATFFEMPIWCPKIPEQRAIAKQLETMDSLITLHQRKHDKLVQLKKSMLDKMFPKPGETEPEIRFAGFTDPWEQRKLGDCFDFLQNNTLSRADLNLESGSARNIHYGDILIKFGDCLGLGSDKLPFVDDESILSKYVNSTLRVGDVIFADTAEDESAGKCVELVKLPNEPVISGLHTIPARPKFPFGSGYLGHYLNAPAYHDQLLPLLQGIKVVSISKTALQDTQICFPTALEQSAIGASLNALDSLITLHQREPGFTDTGYMRVERALMTMSMSLFSSS